LSMRMVLEPSELFGLWFCLDSLKNHISIKNMNTDNTFTITTVNREHTDDGDVLVTFKVVAKGFAGVRDYNEHAAHSLSVWKGIGNGFVEATFTRLVDGVEIAILRSAMITMLLYRLKWIDSSGGNCYLTKC
jgi:hypothetical protein